MPRALSLLLFAVSILLVVSACAGSRLTERKFSDGRVSSSGHLVRGKQYGEWSYFFSGGQVQARGMWTRDKQDGAWTWWHANGQKHFAGAYQRGLRQGRWDEWYDNGQLASSGDYRRDRQDGPWRFYDRTGEMVASGTFANGLRSGEWVTPTRLVDGKPVVELKALPETQPAALAEVVDVPDTVAAATTNVRVWSPLPLLPSFWTRDEEANVGDWIKQYSTAEAPNTVGDYGSIGGAGESRSELIGTKLPQVRFLSSTGAVIDLTRTAKKGTVVVVMRGFAGQVCLYCAAQTVAISQGIERFTAAGVDVVVIFPGAPESVPAFIQAVQTLRSEPPPMPVGLDVGLKLVRALAIEDDLAKPSSFIVDRGGVVRYAYVGTNMADRPSVEQLLRAVADSLK